jgi:hypothetical protein
VFEQDGRLHALRGGREWRDLVGDNLILSLAQEVERLRLALTACVQARDSACFGFDGLTIESADRIDAATKQARHVLEGRSDAPTTAD